MTTRLPISSLLLLLLSGAAIADVQLETCDYGEHKCYNGGKCIPGLQNVFRSEELFCDCSFAVNQATGEKFVGKYCELPSTQPCDNNNNKNHFCVNGGICNTHQYPSTEFDDAAKPCLCEEGYEGPHCEYQTGEVPDCNLDCGIGHCVLGINNDGIGNDLFMILQERNAFMYCACPPGTSGGHCEHHHHTTTQYRDLADTTVDDDDLDDDGLDDESNIVVDNEDDDLIDDEPEDDDAGVDDFIDDEATGMGDSIQEVLDAKDTIADTIGDGAISTNCSLTCENGGVCRKGVKHHDPALDFLDGGKPFKAHDENYEHCVCEGDWVGLQCEHILNRCPSGQHACLNGGKCVADGDDKEACDCSEASNGANHVAGVGCEHAATEVCTTGELGPGQPKAFCVNEGTCKAKVAAGEEHPGCNCLGDWTGPHCEFDADGNEVFDDDDDVADDDVADDDIADGDDAVENDDDVADGDDAVENDDDVADDDAVEDDSDVDDNGEDEDDDCSLKCENGGVCQKGIKHHDSSMDFIDFVDGGTSQFVSHADSYEHCVCQGDWVGLRCEHVLNRCPSGQHACLNGGKCVADGNDEACDCEDASIGGVNHVAGVGCEHAATEICTTGESLPGQPKAFCVNEGTCKAKVAPGEQHPGCNCVGDWTGQHCELKQATSSLNSNDKSAGDKMIILVATVAVLLTICFACYQIRKLRQRARDLEEEVALKANVRAFSDDPRLVAASDASAYMDDPSFDGSDTTHDDSIYNSSRSRQFHSREVSFV